MYFFGSDVSKKSMPKRIVQYLLCREFGWTPQQLEEMEAEIVEDFLAIMSFERQKQNRKYGR